MLTEYSIINILLFIVVVFVALFIDLYSHKKDEPISFRNAAAWSIFWVTISFIFAGYIGLTHGADKSSLFISGYLLEKSLSVDNLFVFMAIFASFGIKDYAQHRILYFGILGALIFRLLFIAAGTSFLLLFGKWALGFFGIFVLWSAWKMYQQGSEDNEEIVDYTNHWSVRMTKKIFRVHPYREGHCFFTTIDTKTYCTPLFLCLAAIEIADIMFAFDSVPAVIAITQEPFLVYTSNIFAILGLRSMYFLLLAAKRYLCHLEKAVIGILVFIGIKMLVDVIGVYHLTPKVSLIVVSLLLTMGIIASLFFPEQEEEFEKVTVENKSEVI
jgi:tellurite resistance protein TerC